MASLLFDLLDIEFINPGIKEMVLMSKKVTIRLNNAANNMYLNALPFFKIKKKLDFFTLNIMFKTL